MTTDIVDRLRAPRFTFQFAEGSAKVRPRPIPRFPTKLALDAADEIERLRRDIASKQAEIDRLMLEFCPGEMTPEQRTEWGRHQQTYHMSEAEQRALSNALKRSVRFLD